MIWPSISVGITSPTTKPHRQPRFALFASNRARAGSSEGKANQSGQGSRDHGLARGGLDIRAQLSRGVWKKLGGRTSGSANRDEHQRGRTRAQVTRDFPSSGASRNARNPRAAVLAPLRRPGAILLERRVKAGSQHRDLPSVL